MARGGAIALDAYEKNVGFIPKQRWYMYDVGDGCAALWQPI